MTAVLYNPDRFVLALLLTLVVGDMALMHLWGRR